MVTTKKGLHVWLPPLPPHVLRLPWRRARMHAQLAMAYFAYLRWAVTESHGGGDPPTTRPTALPPHGPGAPASVHALGPRPERHAVPLVAPLQEEWGRETGTEGQGGREERKIVRTKERDRERG